MDVGWLEELSNLFGQLGISVVRGVAPTYDQVLLAYPLAPASFDFQGVYEATLYIYQDKNTLMYYVVRGSIDLSGPFERTDLLMLSLPDYCFGDARDGWRLFQWVLRFCDTSTIGAQTELRRKVEAA